MQYKEKITIVDIAFMTFALVCTLVSYILR